MKKKDEPKNSLLEAIAEINLTNDQTDEKNRYKIVDIMTFCNDPKYLDLPNNNFHLWMAQKVILKCFYMGTKGNEDLKLTQEEWEWLYKQAEPEIRDDFVYEKNIADVISKLKRKEQATDKEKEGLDFRELHLVMGRRGSKTILTSIITVYEVYKLLVIGEGNPHKYYQLPDDDEIAIINVALSEKQAGRLFYQIEARIRNSPFFTGRIASGTTREIRLYTDEDLKKKKKGTNLNVAGSILILCGRSNPDTLTGYNAILILFDELAFYDEGGKVTGKYFYNRLKPSLTHFMKYGDGKLVEISSPHTTNSIFYDIWKDAKTDPNILSFQLPTWDTNPGVSYDHPDLKKERESNMDMFTIEYGAQWARTGSYGHYFEPELIDRCVAEGLKNGLAPQNRPQPYINYYLHIDPANGGSRYVAVLVAKEEYTNHMGKRRIRIKLAHVWVWNPIPGKGLDFNAIDREVINICATFHPWSVGYDQYNSVQSLQLLKSHGINCIQIAFNRSFKQKIYQNLREKMIYEPSPELWLYEDGLLISELKALKYRPTNRGIGFVTDKHGDVKTDDVADCLAGATAMASETIRAPLPPISIANIRLPGY